MEVHKHPHHLTHKEKWTEYLLEFFMLFLAVFLGFVAENIRENIAERHREKEYIQSMINDLKNDTTTLSVNLPVYEKYILMQDTAIRMFALLDKGYNQTFFRTFNAFESFQNFMYSDATIQQLKNSGGFRLIRNHKTIDSIMRYDAVVKMDLGNEAALDRILDNMDEYNNEMFNKQVLIEQTSKGKTLEQLEADKFDVLFSHDKTVMSKYFNHLVYYKRMFIIVRDNLRRVKSSASSLISFLQNEYHLENE